MKRLALAVVLVLQACGKPAPPAAPPTAPTTSTAPAAPVAATPVAPTAPAVDAEKLLQPSPEQAAAFAPLPPRAAGAPKPAPIAPTSPDVSLVINGQSYNPQVVAGWPVLVSVELRSPDGKPWSVSGVKLEAESWPVKPAFEAPKEAVADAEKSPRRVWLLAPDESAKLPRGAQTVRVVVESAGATKTRELRVQVVDEPAKLHPAWADRKVEVAVDYVFWTEGAEKALARLDALQPPTWKFLALKAQLLGQLKRFGEGVKALDQAIALWQKQVPPPDHLPLDLVAQRDALIRAAVASAGK